MRQLLSDYKDCVNEKILTGNGYIVAKGIGNVTLHTSVGLRTIHDVFFVPALAGKHNLLSVPQIIRKGCSVTMSRLSGCKIFSNDAHSVLLLEGSFTGHGFLVDMAVCRTTTAVAKLELHSTPSGDILLPTHMRDEGRLAMLAGSSDTQPIEMWHMRLGHLNQSAIRQLASMATGLNIGPSRAQTVSMSCDSCLRGAQHKQVSYSRSRLASKRLEHVWADIKGPLLNRDVYGFRFFCIFICEFTRWTAVYPLLEKGHAFGAFKIYEARYERLASEKILNLHIDGGPEFLSTAFRSHLRNAGIALCVTQPYSPEMNSLAERALRTITEHASAMLWNAILPVSFWSCAVETSVYLLNRSPHSALDNKTPYQAWYGAAPNLGHLRVFGCRASAHVPNELRTKTDWASKSTSCIFIGYSVTENLYKLWDITKRSVIKKRDVIFWEHEMSHPSLRSEALTHGVSIDPNLGAPAPPLPAPDLNPAGIAGIIADSEAENLIPPVPPPTVSPPMPLTPPASQQSVQKLQPEPSEQQRVKTGGDLRFIPYVPPAANMALLPPTISTVPGFSTTLPLGGTVDLPLEPSVDPLTFDSVLDPLRDRPLAFGEDVEYAMALTAAIDIFDLTVPDVEPKPIPVPPLHRDVPRSYKQAMSHPRRDRWLAAMNKELKSLQDNETWDLVPLPPGRKAFPNKWVYSYVSGPKLIESAEKRLRAIHGSGELPPEAQAELDSLRSGSQVMEKARLVARGDLQREGIDYTETYAPVIKFVSLQVLLTWAAKHNFRTRHWDIVSAFLHGNIDMEIFMYQPQGFSDGTNRVCRLKKAIYGLCQAARQFYLRLDEILRHLNFTRLAADWALWVRSDGAFIAAHVDDMAAAADTNATLDQIATHLGGYVELKDLGEISEYLSVSIKFDEKQRLFLLSQEQYILQLLADYDMGSCFPVHTPVLVTDKAKWYSEDTPLLDKRGQRRYQALIGSLLYLMHATRPDLAFTVIRLSQFAAHPRECHWLALKRVLRYLKGTSSAVLTLGDLSTTGTSSKSVDNSGLVGYFDVAHADHTDCRSTCGYVFLFFGSPVSWASRVQRTVALSTTEAELMAGTEAAREAIWIKSLTDSLFLLNPSSSASLTCELRGDNQGALALAVNSVFHHRTKHINIRHRFLCDVVNDGIVTVKYVPTADMLADGLTKALPRDTHLDHCTRLGLRLYPSPEPTDAVNTALVVTVQKKRKVRCDDCGNLFSDEAALHKHKLKKES